MVSYTVTNGTTPADVLDMEVSESTNEIDECQILTYGKYSDNSTLVVSDSTPSTVFTGYQTGVEQNDNYNVTYKTIIREKAIEMQYVILTGTTGQVSFVKSDTAANLIAWAISQVNAAYGYTGGDAWSVSYSGSGASTSLTIGCYYTNALSFLKKVIIDNLGYKLWFDSVNKIVYFGEYNVDRTATPIAYIDKQEIRDSTRRGCNRVIVIGKNASITGDAGSGNLIRVFEYPSAATSAECDTLAAKILSDVQYTNVQYTVTLEDTAVCDVADYINLDGTNYIVIKKVTTFDKTIITTGALTTSILDTLGSSITEVSGETVSGSDASWSGGNTNVAANGASYTEYVFDVKDINMISNAKLDATIGSFIKSADVAASTAVLSETSQVIASTTADTSSLLSVGTHYFPDSTGMNCCSNGGSYMNGYQFGLAVAVLNIVNSTDITNSSVYLEVRNGSGSWQIVATLDLHLHNTAITNHITLTGLFSGWETQENSSNLVRMRIRIEVGSGDGSILRLYRYTLSAGRTTRHAHTVATTYNKTAGSNTPATSLYIKVNSSADIAFTPGTTSPLDIQSYLKTGKNIIYVKTPSAANNQCSVNPSITYQTLGKS